MDSEQIKTILNSAGVTNSSGGFNWGNIIAGLIFGAIGTAAFMYGKSNKSPKPLMIGIILCVYTFFVTNLTMIYVIGIALTALLYFWRD